MRLVPARKAALAVKEGEGVPAGEAAGEAGAVLFSHPSRKYCESAW